MKSSNVHWLAVFSFFVASTAHSSFDPEKFRINVDSRTNLVKIDMLENGAATRLHAHPIPASGIKQFRWAKEDHEPFSEQTVLEIISNTDVSQKLYLMSETKDGMYRVYRQYQTDLELQSFDPDRKAWVLIESFRFTHRSFQLGYDRESNLILKYYENMSNTQFTKLLRPAAEVLEKRWERYSERLLANKLAFMKHGIPPEIYLYDVGRFVLSNGF